MIRIPRYVLVAADRDPGSDFYLLTLEVAKELRRDLGRQIEQAEAALEEERRTRLAEEYIDRSTRW